MNTWAFHVRHKSGECAMPKYSEDDKARALVQLREWLKPGATVSCILRHKSRSGMSRSISLLAAVGGEMIELDYHASRAMDDSIGQKHGGIRVGGCGMDMGFALVYNLASTLWPAGFGCIGEKGPMRCPSNDHSNGDRDYTPHSCGLPLTRHAETREPLTWQHEPGGTPRRVAHWHSSGGYALRHRWM